MVEISDEEWMIIANYIKELPDAWAIAEAPEEEQNKYTEVLQIVNAFGPEGQQEASQPEMAAPA